MSLELDLGKEINLIKNVSFAYLFGSYAMGRETTSSDIDVAVYLKEVTLDNELQIIFELSKFLKKDVDLVVLNKTRNLFLLESIFAEGIVLKDNGKRLEYEVMMEHAILDYKSFKKYINAA